MKTNDSIDHANILAVMFLFTFFFAAFLNSAYATEIQVNETNDELNNDGDCSLREAIKSANEDVAYDACSAGSGYDVVLLESGTYLLDLEGDDEDEGKTGDLDIWQNLVIKGEGADTTIIDGNEKDRIFDINVVAYLGTVEIEGVTIQNGYATDGGGIRSNYGEIKLVDSIVKSNTVYSNENGYGTGGGIFCERSGLIGIDVVIIGNRASHNSGGISCTPLAIMDSEIIGNISSSNIGGIHSNRGEIIRSIIKENVAEENIGGIGGAELIISESSIVDNYAHNDKGGISTEYLTLKNSVVSGNVAGNNAGGIHSWATVDINTSTISGNTSGGLGGGIYTEPTSPFDVHEIANSTISDNSAKSGGAIYGTATFYNSIIANNSGGNCSEQVIGSYNIEDIDSCGLDPTNNLINTNPMLDSLQDNGGPTKTHALLLGSPAIDSALDAKCLEEDQRGVSRDIDGDGDGIPNCDIGAYEFDPNIKVLSDSTWKSYDVLQPGWETADFDDSGWPDAYSPYPFYDGYSPEYYIPGTEASYMWDWPNTNIAPTGQDGPTQAWFRKSINIPAETSNILNATAILGADDDFDFYVNGQKVFSDWNGVVAGAPYTVDIKPYLLSGKNQLAMYAEDSYGDWEWGLVDITIALGVLEGDLNNDGCVDRTDLDEMLSLIQDDIPDDEAYDLNGDGAVNIADARYLVTLFSNPKGDPCPTP